MLRGCNLICKTYQATRACNRKAIEKHLPVFNYTPFKFNMEHHGSWKWGPLGKGKLLSETILYCFSWFFCSMSIFGSVFWVKWTLVCPKTKHFLSGNQQKNTKMPVGFSHQKLLIEGIHCSIRKHTVLPPKSWVFSVITCWPIPSMGLVYLPTFIIKTNQNVGKHTSPMDGMGLEISSKDVGTSFHGLNIAKLLHQNKVFNGLTIPFQYFIG